MSLQMGPGAKRKRKESGKGQDTEKRRKDYCSNQKTQVCRSDSVEDEGQGRGRGWKEVAPLPQRNGVGQAAGGGLPVLRMGRGYVCMSESLQLAEAGQNSMTSVATFRETNLSYHLQI